MPISAGPVSAQVSVMIALIAFGIAVLAALTITPRVTRFATRWRFHTEPSGERRIHEQPTPWLGGVAVLASMLIALLAVAAFFTDLSGFMGHEGHLLGIFAGGGLLFVVGLADDFVEFRAHWTGLAQLMAAICVVASGLAIETVTFGGDTSIGLGLLSVPATVFWIVGVTNAFNLIDGLDGLAAGVGFVALTATAIGAAILGNVAILLLSASLAGGLLGFLRYNYNPAQIFLGNAGSFVIGFLLAVLSMHGSVSADDAGMLILVPLFALALPLLDTTLAIVRRWLRGAPIFAGDARHVHHRLLNLGLTQRGAVHVLWAAAVTFAALGLTIAFAPEPLNMVAAVVGGLGCAVGMRWALAHLDYSELRIAARVLTLAPFSIRQAVQDQIHAELVAQRVQSSTTLEELNEILQDNANDFGFQNMLVRRERDRWLDASRPLAAPRTQQVDVPIESPARDENSLVLHIRCGTGSGSWPRQGEQVAHILVPVLERWVRTQPALVNGPDVEAPPAAGRVVAEPDRSGRARRRFRIG